MMLLCIGMAGLGATQGELMHQQQEGGSTEEFRFLSMSVTHKQPWYLAGAGSETAVGRSQKKSLELFGAQSQGSLQ